MNRHEEFEIFVRIVETGSISAAASGLNIAKSAVSRRLQQLETRLGVQLIVRTTRQNMLTEAGKVLYARAKILLADWQETENALSKDAHQISGPIRVTAPLSFGVAHLGPAILEFMTQHPAVNFDIDFSDRKSDLIADGVDLAVRIGKLENSGLIARKLAPIKTIICASPAFLEAHGRPDSPEALSDLPELQYSPRAEAGWTYRGPDGGTGRIRLQPALSASNGDFLREAALAGKGVLIAPCFLTYKALRQGHLCELLPEYEWGDLALYAVYPPTRHLSSRVRYFVDFLVERFRGKPYWEDYQS